MMIKARRATVLLCSVAVAAFATSALARPVHHHRQRATQASQITARAQTFGADRDLRYSSNATYSAQVAASAECALVVLELIRRTSRISAEPQSLSCVL